jgi:hypothetical protein
VRTPRSLIDRAPAVAIAGGSAAGTWETIMTRQADCKRRVRARMARTSESYAAARSRLLADYPGMVPGDSRLDWMPGVLHVSTATRPACREPGSRGRSQLPAAFPAGT